MQRLIFASLLLGLAACASNPPGPGGAGFTEDTLGPNRYRISYAGPAAISQKEVEDRTLARAAQLTLEKGNEWFEIKDQASGDHKRTLEIITGKGETLAGGKIYDARKTLAEVKARAAAKKSKTS